MRGFPKLETCFGIRIGWDRMDIEDIDVDIADVDIIEL
jgi:hypothetical protein